MEEKIKVLITGKKRSIKQKTPKGSMGLKDVIEREIPDMYEFISGDGEDAIEQEISRHCPEIVLITQIEPMDGLNLLIKAKQLNPATAVFILIFGIIDDEQEAIDEYMAAGAYKCFLPPLMIESLVHDMYVALNLE